MNRIPELTLSRTDACLRRRYTARFANSAGVVLLATGTAKVWSSFGQAKLLALPDPILGLAFGKLMLLVGLAELAIALCCLLPRVEARLKIYLVAWMATNFLLYRVGLWCIGWHHPCGCMGSLAGVLGLTDSAADRVMKGLLAYLLAGSYL